MEDQKDQIEGADSAADAPEESAPEKPAASASSVRFNDHITIFPSQPLPHLDRGPVKAYGATGSGKAPSKLYALICHPQYSPRTNKASSYATLINPCLPRLVTKGVIDWPQDKQQCYVFLYEDNNLTPIVKDDTASIALGLKPEIVTSAIVQPLVSALTDMRNKDLIHGAIRPGNLFGRQKAQSIESIAFGDCLSLPCGVDMPALYETVERAMADPIGRGVGTFEDDMYSFGVTLAVLLRSHDPMEGLSDREIIQHKMEHGTFSSLISKDRFGGSILELMRGLLFDDVNQRWTLEDVEAWLEGQRLTNKPPGKKIKAKRPIIIGGQKYSLPELVAYNSAEDPVALVECVENDDMFQWIKRATESKILLENYERAYGLAQEGGRDSNYPDRLATRLSIALHPEAPIRYRELRVFPDGIGKSLSNAIIRKSNPQSYHDLIANFFVMQWIDMHNGAGLDISSLTNRFGTCRKYIKQKQIGYGLERCVYYLNPESHCLSSKLNGFYVRNAEDMIRAFEKISSRADKPLRFFDRHSVAFLSIKDSKIVERFLHDLQSPDEFQVVMAELKVLEAIQRKFKMEKFKGVAKWIADAMEPVYAHIHSRIRRVKLKENIEKIKQSGDLTKLLALFDNDKLFTRDYDEYREAMKHYLLLDKEQKTLELRIEKDPTFGQSTGRTVAAIISCFVAALVIAFTVMVEL